MQWVANTLHTTSEHAVSSITTADAAHLGCQQSTELTPRPPGRFKWTRPVSRERRNLVSAHVPSHSTGFYHIDCMPAVQVCNPSHSPYVNTSGIRTHAFMPFVVTECYWDWMSSAWSGWMSRLVRRTCVYCLGTAVRNGEIMNSEMYGLCQQTTAQWSLYVPPV